MGELSLIRRRRLPSMTNKTALALSFVALQRTQLALPCNCGTARSLSSTGRMGTNPPHLVQVIAHHFSVGVTNAPSLVTHAPLRALEGYPARPSIHRVGSPFC